MNSVVLFPSRREFIRSLSNQTTRTLAKMSGESQEPTNDETPVVNEGEEVKGGEPPAKKKRGASHQITKDDYEDEDDEGDENNDDKLKQGFKRASDDVLAKRKIYKVKRDFGAKPAETTPATDKEDSEEKKETAPASASSNPFASTSFASSTEKPKTGFGFGSSSGFGAASGSSSKSGFGTASGSTGSGFGNGSSGFGFASVGTSGKSSGFGSSSGSGSSSGFTFGSKAAANGSPSKSLFGNPSSINFSLSKPADDTKKEIELTKLPENVDLKTGEEDETEVHSGRCKSFEWILDDATNGSSADGSGGDGNSSSTKTNPSVQSSTQFQAAISSSKSNGESDENDTESNSASDTKANGATDSKASGTCEKHRWTELGIGPVKILQSKSNPERLRVVQRRESSKMGPATKVILNIPLWRESTCERDRQALQYLRLKTMKEGKMGQYLLKFKDNSGAGYFYHYLTERLPMARKCFADTSTE